MKKLNARNKTVRKIPRPQHITSRVGVYWKGIGKSGNSEPKKGKCRQN